MEEGLPRVLIVGKWSNLKPRVNPVTDCPRYRWAYVKKHNVQLPDEYDQIYHDLEPFWGMHTEEIRIAQAETEKRSNQYILASQGGKFVYAGDTIQATPEQIAGTRIRSNEQVELLKEVQEWLPDFRATFGLDDSPSQFLGYDLYVSLKVFYDIMFASSHICCIGNATSCMLPPKRQVRLRPIVVNPSS
jgi:hypothetical protein